MAILNRQKDSCTGIIDVQIADLVGVVRQVLHCEDVSITFTQEVDWGELLGFITLKRYFELFLS